MMTKNNERKIARGNARNFSRKQCQPKRVSLQKILVSHSHFSAKTFAEPPIRSLSNLVNVSKAVVDAQFNMIPNRISHDNLQTMFKDSDNNEKKTTRELMMEVTSVLDQFRSLLALRNNGIIKQNREVVETYLQAKRNVSNSGLSFRIPTPKNEVMLVTANIPCLDLVAFDSNPKRVKTNENITITIQSTKDINNTHIDIEKNNGKTEYVVRSVAMPVVIPLPQSVAHFNINRSCRSEDPSNMRFMPYFDDNNESVMEIDASYSVPLNDFDVSGEAEEETIYCIFKKYGCSVESEKEEVLAALSNVMRISKNNIMHAFKRVNEGKRDKELRSTSNEINASRIIRLGSSVLLPLDGPAPPSFFNSEKFSNNVGLRDVASHGNEVYKDYFCRVCYNYYCTLHGIEQPQPSDRIRPSAPPFCPVPDLKLPSDSIRRTTNSHSSSLDNIPYKLYPDSNSDDGLKDYEKSIILKLNNIFSNNRSGKKVEMLAKLLGTRDDLEVGEFLKNGDPVLCLPSTAKGRPKKKVRRRNPVNKSAAKNLEHKPCNHEGPCNDDCPCVCNGDSNNGRGFCEKYCACPPDCGSRFQGCHCRTGCSTNTCPCFIASRECDPDLCGECGSCIHPMYLPLVNNYLQQHKEIYESSCNEYHRDLDDDAITKLKKMAEYKLCSNTNLTRGVGGAQIMIARSCVHGWGAFLKTGVEKNAFIIEYTGEVIADEEAERRGRNYDRIDRSFLFKLNEELSIDATRNGNKAKFINHSNDPNCYVRTLLIKGEHRLAIFSKERISAGKELFFDYNYGRTAPQWVLVDDDPNGTGSKSNL